MFSTCDSGFLYFIFHFKVNAETFTNAIERQRDLGITGKCLESIQYMMFMVTSQKGLAFLTYVLFLSKYLFRKFSKNNL